MEKLHSCCRTSLCAVDENDMSSSDTAPAATKSNYQGIKHRNVSEVLQSNKKEAAGSLLL
jgi:hypothetical protein